MNFIKLASLAFFISLTACTMTQQPIGNPEAPYPAVKAPSVGDIYHLPTGVKVTEEQMTDAIKDVRIIYIGETHDNPAAHRLQLEVLKAVAAAHPGELSLGMEMFNPTQQEVLDRWVAGELDEKTFLKEVKWFSGWSMDFAYYKDILHFAREARIPVIGLNATKQMVKTVGATSLDELDDETISKLPEFDLEDPYQRAMSEAIFADHSQGKSMLDGFQRVQTLWDETMAENIAKTLQEKGPEHRMVVLAGGNHVRYGYGIPRRVYRRLPTSYVLVGSREIVVPEEKQAKIMDVDLPTFPMVPYDYVQYTEYESLPGERAKLGVRMSDESGKVVVEGVVPGSTADNAGVKEGDIIIKLGEAVIKDNFDLVYEVSQKSVGDKVKLEVERKEQSITVLVEFTLLPQKHPINK